MPGTGGAVDSWTAGVEEDHATLDGIRAAESFAPAGLAGRDTRVAMMGYSVGSQASQFATEMAPKYAPELNVVGVASGGLPVNVAHAAKKADGGAFAGKKAPSNC